MKPRPLNLAAAVSLLLAVAIVVLWVRSYWHREGIERRWHTSTELCVWTVDSGYGTAGLSTIFCNYSGPPIAPSYKYEDRTQRDPTGPVAVHWVPLPPLRFGHVFPTAGSLSLEIRYVSVAYWLLLPPTLLLPAIALGQHRRRRRRERGNLCPTCGYDRRAHSPTARCPECGTVPAVPAR